MIWKESDYIDPIPEEINPFESSLRTNYPFPADTAPAEPQKSLSEVAASLSSSGCSNLLHALLRRHDGLTISHVEQVFDRCQQCREQPIPEGFDPAYWARRSNTPETSLSNFRKLFKETFKEKDGWSNSHTQNIGIAMFPEESENEGLSILEPSKMNFEGLVESQLRVVHMQIKNRNRPVFDILMDTQNYFHAWFRIVVTKEPDTEIIEKFQHIAQKEIQDSELREYLVDNGFDLSRITKRPKRSRTKCIQDPDEKTDAGEKPTARFNQGVACERKESESDSYGVISYNPFASLVFSDPSHVPIEKPAAVQKITIQKSPTERMRSKEEAMHFLSDKVDVCNPVEKYLPEFKSQMFVTEKDAEHMLLKKPSHPITVKEILSHTSGLPFKTPVEEPKLDILPLHSAVRSYAMSPLFSQPGTRYEYSNAGTNTAGRIIEVVSGMSYGEFMHTRVFDPLGMSDTTFVPTDAQTARLAKVYKPGPENTGLVESVISQVTYPLTNPLRQPFPAGGLFSSGHDLVRFCQMILNGGELDGKRYLSTASVQEMIRKQTADMVTKEYGYGWETADGRFGHGGALATKMTIDPKRGLIMVFLLQHEGFPGEGGQAQETFIRAAVEWSDSQVL